MNDLMQLMDETEGRLTHMEFLEAANIRDIIFLYHAIWWILKWIWRREKRVRGRRMASVPDGMPAVQKEV